MTGRKRRNDSPESKANVTLAAICDDKTLVKLAQQYDVHATQIQNRKKRWMAEAGFTF